MQIRQYAYFGLASDTITATDITARIGIQPDSVLTKGARLSSPPRPAAHRWKLDAQPTGSVDQMLAELVDRIRPAATEIKALVDSGEASAVFQIVRNFGDPGGEEEDLTTITTPEGEATKLAGQHQLLGFHLDLGVLRFASDHGIAIDVDEYG